MFPCGVMYRVPGRTILSGEAFQACSLPAGHAHYHGQGLPPRHTTRAVRTPWIKVVAYACQCGALLVPTTQDEETEILRETPCCGRHGAKVLTEREALIRYPGDGE